MRARMLTLVGMGLVVVVGLVGSTQVGLMGQTAGAQADASLRTPWGEPDLFKGFGRKSSIHPWSGRNVMETVSSSRTKRTPRRIMSEHGCFWHRRPAKETDVQRQVVRMTSPARIATRT